MVQFISHLFIPFNCLLYFLTLDLARSSSLRSRSACSCSSEPHTSSARCSTYKKVTAGQQNNWRHLSQSSIYHTHRAPSDLQFKVQLHAPPLYVVRIPFYNTLEWWISFLQVTVFEKIHTFGICFCDESVHFFIVPAEEQGMVFCGFRTFLIVQ